MKSTKILLTHVFFFGLLINSFSAEKISNSNAKKIDINSLEYVNGLYYYHDQLYTGLFYNIFSSKGPIDNSNDSYFEGELINGERHGEWVWYRYNEMNHKQTYENGVLTSDVIVINNK